MTSPEDKSSSASARFRSQDPVLAAAYERKRHLVVLREPKPAANVCDSCWGQAACSRRVLMRQPPRTCCVYTHFEQRETTTVEEMVKWTCENACVSRQSWAYDHVPHTPDYCRNHCPVSQFLLDHGPSDYE